MKQLMVRDFKHINFYLNSLLEDIYPQPEDEGHTSLALEVFNRWIRPNSLGKSVLDVGCGDTAFMKRHFEGAGISYTGVALHHPQTDDSILSMDFSFLEFGDNSFDFIFSRHALEHSPMPLLSLMEWHRVARFFLCLILPDPNYYGWAGRNHYAVMNRDQATFLLERAGWKILWEDKSNPSEIRYMCEKVTEKLYE